MLQLGTSEWRTSPYSQAATLDTGLVASGYPGGIRTHLSTNHSSTHVHRFVPKLFSVRLGSLFEPFTIVLSNSTISDVALQTFRSFSAGNSNPVDRTARIRSVMACFDRSLSASRYFASDAAVVCMTDFKFENGGDHPARAVDFNASQNGRSRAWRASLGSAGILYGDSVKFERV